MSNISIIIQKTTKREKIFSNVGWTEGQTERGTHGEMESRQLDLSVELGVRGWRCKGKSLVA